jgi:hypothetical protein|tara:strand:+ start:60 stop:221 length:162 start_codon:yes stop_codon:yes gene_type:complete
VHDPEGKELVFGIRGKPDSGNAAPAYFFPKSVAAKLSIFLNRDIGPSDPSGFY